ncbi:hypothetical protein E6P09_13535 [Haloferax mediterranei ATCC 33500]|uniref:DUF8135 domain-containing protein n=1 Tax=Haloferax mediterranei (strain ATCC 33500 / DSM 1411 / JCM 8866 / NBRC 14739 / NCIMB 2177 / R-4) TaxID=523841 RepID=I3R7W6_HALMT|nr:hypothetical protein [Haloferax mediterranei]AFK20326.1 hypothetical protein HFX_2648 [Haloferax mediterranei ATCC 33500]AHZ23695.1 hypothetical protein BM92_14055 [Haloferax mediterranei ATCC 33500]ELZ99182.1 hypothetical protein C439_15024 [Haloferax mediterranei ATCC 33500]MDX5986918.1 hypothetical protein [Haloferax mediterranei ATCC 33500]QCQ76240.1 hypothetical protein E6P09_13535 [Haloferax mediterranei ATCC 33500]
MTDDTAEDDATDERRPEREPATADEDTDWSERTDAERSNRADAERSDRADADEQPQSAPLSDLAGRVAERRGRSRVSNEPDDVAELFESVEVDELDDEDVWTALVEGGDETESVGLGAEAEAVDDADGLPDHIVAKKEFCQRCEHFGAPPKLACTHEGTAIIEVVDSDHFRVRNCPIVEDDE